jgi:osmotically-inducible protein OsmY
MRRSSPSPFMTLVPTYSLACVLVLAGAISGCAAESSGERMTDDTITANVQAMINKHPDVGPPDSIHVETRNHVVYLSGFVSTGLMKSTAEDLAQHSRGVTNVVSDIAVAK